MSLTDIQISAVIFQGKKVFVFLKIYVIRKALALLLFFFLAQMKKNAIKPCRNCSIDYCEQN